MRLSFPSLFVLLLAGGPACAEDTLVLVDGTQHTGLIRLSEAGELMVKAPAVSSEKRFDASNVERVILNTTGKSTLFKEPYLQFRNGDRLAATVTEFESGQIEASTKAVGNLLIRPTAVSRVLLNRNVNASASPRGEPGVRLTTDEFIPGKCVGMTPETVSVRHRLLGLVPMPRQQIAEIVIHEEYLYRMDADSVLTVVVLTSGECITGTLRRLDEKSVGLHVTWQTVEPVELAFDVARVAELRFLNGRVRYLSEFEPAEVTLTPYFSFVSPYRRNANALGGPLRIGDKDYSRGVGCHTRTRLVYDLGKQYESFRSDVGLDRQIGRGGDVEFLVYVDRDAGESVFRALVAGGREPKFTGNIGLSGASRLILVVDYARHGSVQDYANWGNALLVRKAETTTKDLNRNGSSTRDSTKEAEE